VVGVFALPAWGLSLLVAAADIAVPAQPIQVLHDVLLHVMKAGTSATFTQRCAMLAPVVERTFDLNEILQVSVGRAWRTLPAAQQAQLKVAFQQYTVATYVANFGSYSGQRFEIIPNLRPAGNGAQIVDTKIIPTDGSNPVEMDFLMGQVGDSWKAVDVLLDGSISRVAIYVRICATCSRTERLRR
jgi:phospholipid transport system substrate-binding protein